MLNFVLFLIFLSVLVAYHAIVQVPQGYAFTVERFGRYIQTFGPGLHFILPFIERVGARINVMERVLNVPSQNIISKDNAMVRIDGVCFFKVIEPSFAAYKIIDLEDSVINLITTNIRTVLGGLDLDEMLSHRDEINLNLLKVLHEATESWGIKVTRIEIRDIHPPEDLAQAMAAQMKAEREKRAAILEAEGFKQSEILKAEGIKTSKILQAEAERAERFLQAEAREREAQAEATANDILSKSIRNGRAESLQYSVAQQYIRAFSSLAQSHQSKTIFMPFESSQLMGSLGAFKELWNQVEVAPQESSGKKGK
jgi:regulator of protease activity HflC (stomatin/prohibitin superfamily)